MPTISFVNIHVSVCVSQEGFMEKSLVTVKEVLEKVLYFSKRKTPMYLLCLGTLSPDHLPLCHHANEHTG